MTRLFVYGTLLAGEVNHGHLRGAELLGEVRTPPRFELHDLGRYPALVRGGRTRVIGELYAVDPETLVMIDALEGHPTYYRRAPITLEGGEQVETYLLEPGQVAGFPVITSGSWRARGG